ncbi:SDR family oxidoreductase [Flammeovirga kamogawensis]|uniref:SDR family NAD(P)-dependent oxidoreductase n=1 Tax=Flammeovirga kamogawensis TaxID=373891 RepID=A0ABX8GZ66_9BACT|nr:SDR family NAD(P)-dependent oxidoreductase [Flammeovirga kamogawensis]MBB6459137.1 3-oxoacyl-[acyl-carrier protein] reductase [Flammeovirga kamogawensis]QWG08704.1 SDR family NAD(P)-dependent oxidoreductase [Flammeovirga kamogawensis]TRX66998.1 SDR family NAD(P)-dependent oxidoreductase [Flammeovirga kamogawensis]
MDLQNKRILITGGSSGIGKQTAKLLIAKGAKVVITGRSEEKLLKVAEEIGAIPLLFDIAKHDTIHESALACVKALDGGIDVLINNAGIGEFAELEDVSLSSFQRVFDVNVFGLAELTKCILPYFQEQGSGNIINIGSTAAAKGFAFGSVYVASKFALRGLTQCWQAELRKYNIRVSLINPSEVVTAFGTESREEKPEEVKKLTATEIAHTIVSSLELDDRGFIPEVTVWATNP